jgi:hypothetical protein
MDPLLALTAGYNLFQNEHVFICDLSDLTLHIVFDAWCASMNVVLKCPIASNHSRHASSWGFYLHCEIEQTGCPGIICILCHHGLRHPAEPGTSTMGKHLLGKSSHHKVKQVNRVRSF